MAYAAEITIITYGSTAAECAFEIQYILDSLSVNFSK